MADAVIEAKADRYVRSLRRMLAKIGPVGPDVLARARRHAVRTLLMEKGRRDARRRRHEMTFDIFNDSAGEKR